MWEKNQYAFLLNRLLLQLYFIQIYSSPLPSTQLFKLNPISIIIPLLPNKHLRHCGAEGVFPLGFPTAEKKPLREANTGNAARGTRWLQKVSVVKIQGSKTLWAKHRLWGERSFSPGCLGGSATAADSLWRCICVIKYVRSSGDSRGWKDRGCDEVWLAERSHVLHWGVDSMDKEEPRF